MVKRRTNIKKFNGKRYIYLRAYLQKRSASKEANRQRRLGFQARVIQEDSKWVVYTTAI